MYFIYVVMFVNIRSIETKYRKMNVIQKTNLKFYIKLAIDLRALSCTSSLFKVYRMRVFQTIEEEYIRSVNMLLCYRC